MTGIIRTTATIAALCVALTGWPAFAANEPEVIHRHPGHPISADTKSSEDPYKGCTPNAEKLAARTEHPMPDTKGMKNMDPKLHEMDCPETPAPKSGGHIHKPPGGG
jgi:hypothetical protein